MHHRFPWVVSVVVASLLLGPGVGCESCAADLAKQRYRDDETARHAYTSDPAELQKTVAEVMLKRQCALPPPPWTEGQTIEGQSPRGAHTCNVRVAARTAEGARVTVEGIETVTVDGGTTERAFRDVEAEWTLLQRAAPADAARIREEAERRGSVAAEGCRYTCGAPTPSR